MTQAAKKTLVRRYRRDTNEMPFSFAVSRARAFSFEIPDGVPFDDEDTDRIEDCLWEMIPKPDEVQNVVASGLGDLVCSTITVTYWDDKREDYEIMLDIEEAVRAGLKNRAWLVPEGDTR